MPPYKSASQNGIAEDEITLGLLSAIDNNASLTQRNLAQDLGIALGLANAYLKRCVKKGHIKIQQIPANRYSYYLTPQGFAEKSRLTAEYLSQSFKLFRVARKEYSAVFAHCVDRNWKRIAVYGGTDLTEIILICSRDFAIDLIGIVTDSGSFGGGGDIPITKDVSFLAPFDVILIADSSDPQALYEFLAEIVGKERVLAPAFLNISPNRPGAGSTGERP